MLALKHVLSNLWDFIFFTFPPWSSHLMANVNIEWNLLSYNQIVLSNGMVVLKSVGHIVRSSGQSLDLMACKWSPSLLFLGICSFFWSLSVYYYLLLFHSPHIMPNSLQPHGLPRLPCPSLSSRVYSNSRPLNQWCHTTISSSVIPFSSRLPSFPASGSLLMSQFFTSGGQTIETSASASVLPVNIQDWFPLGWTGWISLQSKGLSRVFTSSTIQKHQFFPTQPSSAFFFFFHSAFFMV